MRTVALWLLAGGLGVYAWRDWYKSLCGLILLMAVIEHPDMPNTVFGIQGLNPWNLLLLDVVFAWYVHRENEEPADPMPGHVKVLLWLFVGFIVVGFVRMLNDLDGMREYSQVFGWWMPSTAGLWSEYLINPLKWMVPGLLLFDGCRSRSRFALALAALLGVYIVLALEVLRWMPLQSALDGGDLAVRSGTRLRKEVGYHRTDLSVMLAGASWALFATKEFFKGRLRVGLILVGCLLILLAQALTAGRGGYLAWAMVGLLFCLVRYRKYLLLVPPLVAVVLVAMPGLVDRITTGFRPSGELAAPYHPDGIDAEELSAGRSLTWPAVIEKIKEAPLIGHGREAMKRTGVASMLFVEYGETAAHPHNAYLETLLDGGVLSFVVVVTLYALTFLYSFRLFRERSSDVSSAAGGVGLALIGALLVGALTGQTFYPREASVGPWCAMGLALRVYVSSAAVWQPRNGGDRAALARPTQSNGSLPNRFELA